MPEKLSKVHISEHMAAISKPRQEDDAKKAAKTEQDALAVSADMGPVSHELEALPANGEAP